jgi:hypothetical protein
LGGENGNSYCSEQSEQQLYCFRVTAEGANQNAQRPFFNTEIILMIIIPCRDIPIQLLGSLEQLYTFEPKKKVARKNKRNTKKF